jgi:hypothetical protein
MQVPHGGISVCWCNRHSSTQAWYGGKQPPSVVDPELFALGLGTRAERNEHRVYHDLAREVARLLVIAEKEEHEAKEVESSDFARCPHAGRVNAAVGPAHVPGRAA